MTPAHDLTQDEARALVILEQRPLITAELAPLLWTGSQTRSAWVASAGTAEEAAAAARLAVAVVLRLARLGLASSAGNVWQVTVPGRQVARRLELVPHANDPSPPTTPGGADLPH